MLFQAILPKYFQIFRARQNGRQRDIILIVVKPDT